MQPPVAHNSRPLRRRQPSKTGIHAIENILSQKKQQILTSRMIVSLAFRKLCRFVSSSAGNRKLRRAGTMVFVFILRFHRPSEKIKIRCEAQILCLFYSSTDRLRKLRSACESFVFILRFHTPSEKIKNCSENWKFPFHKILYSMDTCF